MERSGDGHFVICYATDERTAAATLCRALERTGMRAWIGPRDIPPGAGQKDALSEAVSGAWAVIALVSSSAVRSSEMRQLLEMAARAGKPVLPVRLERITLPPAFAYYLAGPRWVDALSPPFEQHLPAIVAAVRRLAFGPEDGRAPAASALQATHHDLPEMLTSFVGRDSESIELATLIGRYRLVTVVGVGGVGKTRLALSVAHQVADRFPEGVRLVQLVGLSDASLVAQAVASALSIPDEPGRSWLDSILGHLRARRLLLVIDNCEHLIDAVAEVAESIISSCGGVHVLATGREALRLPGEVVYQLEPLSVPPTGAKLRSEEVPDIPSVRLFLDRAVVADPEFTVPAKSVPLLAQLCRRLDGLPLALELAAARVRMLSLEEIVDQLQDHFRLLTGGRRTAAPHQQALDATIRWSYELLEPDDRVLFEELSVFAGGFDLKGAQQVCATGSHNMSELIDSVSRLGERSLLVPQHDRGSTRYRMLGILRAFGMELLERHGHAADLRDAHLNWLQDMARRRGHELASGGQQHEPMAAIDRELDNVRAALQWALDSGRVREGLVIAGRLHQYWYMRSEREGRQWLERLLATDHDVVPQVDAPALLALGSILQAQGEQEDSIATCRRGLPLARDAGNRNVEAWLLQIIGRAEGGRGDFNAARASFDEALALFEATGNEGAQSLTHVFLVGTDLLGRPSHFSLAKTNSESEVALQLARNAGTPEIVAHAAECRAVVLGLSSRSDEVRELLHQALTVYQALGDRVGTAHCLENVAGWATSSDRCELAAKLLGAAGELRTALGTPVPWWEAVFVGDAERDAQTCLGERFDSELAAGRRLDLEEALELALRATDVDEPASDEGPR